MKDKCFLNPKFGEGSLLVGGADADLIIDDMLIDFKMIKKAGVDRNHFNQLMGYYLLNEIGGICDKIDETGNKKEKHEINKIGIYSSRYGDLLVYNIDDIFDKSKLDEEKNWFIKYNSNHKG